MLKSEERWGRSTLNWKIRLSCQNSIPKQPLREEGGERNKQPIWATGGGVKPQKSKRKTGCARRSTSKEIGIMKKGGGRKRKNPGWL